MTLFEIAATANIFLIAQFVHFWTTMAAAAAAAASSSSSTDVKKLFCRVLSNEGACP